MAQDYYSHPYISQSQLKALLGKKYDAVGMVGSLTDAMCTEPEKVREFKISNVKPTDDVRRVLNCMYESNHKVIDVSSVEMCRGTYGGNWSNERVVKQLLKYQEYLNDLHSNFTIVTEQEWDQAEHMTKVLKTHPHTQFIKDAYTQVDVYNDDFHGIQAKGRLDFLTKDKRVVDLKTIASIKNVWKNYNSFRYDLQLTWYHDISHARLMPRIIFVAPDADYPIILELSEGSLEAARHGCLVTTETWKVKDKEYPSTYYRYGYMDLIRQYHRLRKIDYPIPPNNYEQITYGITKI